MEWEYEFNGVTYRSHSYPEQVIRAWRDHEAIVAPPHLLLDDGSIGTVDLPSDTELIAHVGDDPAYAIGLSVGDVLPGALHFSMPEQAALGYTISHGPQDDGDETWFTRMAELAMAAKASMRAYEWKVFVEGVGQALPGLRGRYCDTRYLMQGDPSRDLPKLTDYGRDVLLVASGVRIDPAWVPAGVRMYQMPELHPWLLRTPDPSDRYVVAVRCSDVALLRVGDMAFLPPQYYPKEQDPTTNGGRTTYAVPGEIRFGGALLRRHDAVRCIWCPSGVC